MHQQYVHAVRASVDAIRAYRKVGALGTFFVQYMYTRSCNLSRTYFDGTELQEDDLREALAKHAECWTDDSVDPSIAAAEVCHRVTMGSEATAVDRIDAVHSRLEQYFENPSAERVFRDALGAYKRGPAAVISKALVAGLNPPEFKLKVEHQLEMRGAWKDNPKIIGLARGPDVDMGPEEELQDRSEALEEAVLNAAQSIPACRCRNRTRKKSLTNVGVQPELSIIVDTPKLGKVY